MRDLSGRRALFVGGSSGIGLAAARLFHGLGAEVILAGSSADRLEAIRQNASFGMPLVGINTALHKCASGRCLVWRILRRLRGVST